MKFTTPDLCDAFGPELQVADPLLRDWGGERTFAGAIETLRVFEDNALVRQVLETEGRGRVLVIDGGGSLRTALVGGRLASLARDRGWSGLVINGCIRDSTEIAATSLGVKALHPAPMRSGKAGTGERGVPVRFAGVRFTPGGYLYADPDGIVVAPRDLLER